MLFLAKMIMPVRSVQDFIKTAMETLANNPYPEFTKREYYGRFVGDELELTVIYDIERGMEEEGFLDIGKRGYPCYQSVDGLKAHFDPVFTLEQLFALVNQATPAS